MTGSVQRFDSGGLRIYRIPLDLFPGLTGFAHLVLSPEYKILIDVGSGFGASNEQLQAGMDSIRSDHGEDVGWNRLTHIVITHGHIDHYGGLTFVRGHTSAPVGIHRLDRSLLADFERRLELMAGRLRRFLTTAGVGRAEADDLMELYLLNKQLFTSQDVDFTFNGADAALGPLQILHVPGHCPGQVVLRAGDVILTSDHVLPDITPHMAPLSLARHTGLAEYLRSLDRLHLWAAGQQRALGGHGGSILDLHGRIEEIRKHHEVRLQAVLDGMHDGTTIADLANRLFPDAAGYHRLLALEEVGAHLEVLLADRRARRTGDGRRGSIARFQRRALREDRSASLLTVPPRG